MLSSSISSIIIFLTALLAMAFFTLLERKTLGYIQSRKGPNKISLSGIPQPLADALKLFTKEQSFPIFANTSTFIMSPMLSLFLALLLWSLYPLSHSPLFFPSGAILFLCISSLNVYTTLGAGWSSNSKYALLGALRSVAQTISYEVSMTLILLTPLMITMSLSFNLLSHSNSISPAFLMPPLLLCWFITTLAETNRTPFDFAEGESELVSGFNTEYSSGTFALIFMAEYTSILVMALFTATLFFSKPHSPLDDLILSLTTMLFAFMFLWIRGTIPRMRYDHLMFTTWKSFLLFSIASLIFISSMMLLQ